jgi:hypothetical protein
MDNKLNYQYFITYQYNYNQKPSQEISVMPVFVY